MVMGRLQKVVEEVAGLPKLSEASAMLDRLDTVLKSLDEPRLKVLRGVTDNLVKLQAQGGPQGMQVFAAAMQVLANTPADRIDKVVKITEDIRETAMAVQKIVKSLPMDALKSLPINELAEGIKKAMKG
ncbi:MAG: hypothetical protein PHI12_06500 [Dehalococcoidales bacterium]|nr:hypothetical protein [Dehalococcoidales bacterium]